MQEGRAEGSASLLLRQLGRRFGRLPAPVRDRVRAATADDLEAWAMAVLDAGSLDAVFKGGGLTGKRTAGPPPGAAARPVPHFRLTHPAAECGGALPAACGGTGGPRRSRCSRTASAIQRWGVVLPRNPAYRQGPRVSGDGHPGIEQHILPVDRTVPVPTPIAAPPAGTQSGHHVWTGAREGVKGPAYSPAAFVG